MGVYSRGQTCAGPTGKGGGQGLGWTYGKGSLQGDLVLLDALDGGIRDSGLAILQDGVDVDGLPLDGGLCCVSNSSPWSGQRRANGSGRQTLAAAKMSLTATAISGPMPSPSIKLTV